MSLGVPDSANLMCAAAPGTSITVEAVGPQAAEVIQALELLINSRFGEVD